MRRIMLAMAFAVVAVLLAAPAAQAQYAPQEWGYVHANLASTRYNISRLIDDGFRESSRIREDGYRREYLGSTGAYGYGSYGSYYPSYYGGSYYGSSLPGTYGAGYGPYLWGNRYPYGDSRYTWDGRYGRGGVRPGYHHRATQNNVNAWGGINLAAQAIGTVVTEVRADRRHNETMAELRSQRRNDAPEGDGRRLPAEAEPVRVPFTTVVNATGECLQVNGVVMDKAAKLTVRDPEAMQIAAETGSSCRVQAEAIGDYILLTCRK